MSTTETRGTRRAARPGPWRWLDLLAVVSRRLTAAPTLDQAWVDMVDLIVEAFDFECTAYFEPTDDGRLLRLVYGSGNHNEHTEAAVWPTDTGVLGRAARTGRTVLIADVAGDPDYVAHCPDTRSELTVPLVEGGRVVGVLDVQSRLPRFFSSSAVEVVEAIAAQAVVMRRVREMRRRQEQHLLEQRAVHAISLDILAARPWRETLRTVTSQLRTLCNADEAGLYLTEPDGRGLRLAIIDGGDEELVGSRVAIGEGLAGRVAATRHSLVVADYATWLHRVHSYDRVHWRACAAVPLLHGDDVIGVIDVMSCDPNRRFGDDDLRSLELLAAPAALAISNARSAEEHAADLEQAAAIARALSAETDASRIREAICRMAVETTGAVAAGLFEPMVDGPGLGITAFVGAEVPPGPSAPGQGSPTWTAFVESRPVFVGDLARHPHASDLARAVGAGSVLAQPVLRDGVPAGVLGVAWDHRIDRLPERIAALAALLADDAAVAIERADLYNRLDRLARHDPLTRIANRRSWDEELPRFLARAARHRLPVSIAMLDLDHFKDFNDLQGHQRGDRLLREVAAGWQAALRDGDLLARYGGEEFAVLLPGCPLEDALPIVERLRAVMPHGQTCSAGVACWDGAETGEALVARADAALYEAKLAGRDRVTGALPEDGDPAVHPGAAIAGWTRWTPVVPRLLEERSVEAAYQPVVRLDGSGVVGWEALARPTGQEPGMSVEGLFAAAQYRGLGRDLDWLCRRAAVSGAAAMAPGHALFVNVGVSALLDPMHDVDQMLLLLRWAGRSPEDVVLEITEREAVRDLSRFGRVLAVYREHGFRFALDDVGEGHSTLEVLAAASPEFIKVARSMMVAAERPGPRSAIRAVVAFARHAGAVVVAEGIETDAERRRMRDLGVDLGQGWALGRPQTSPVERVAYRRVAGA